MIKFKFELIPEDGVVEPYIRPYGYIFRALLMSWLKEIEPKLVHELHSYNKIRPYSIQLSYRKKELIFYLNTFDPRLANPIINDLINSKDKRFPISDQIFLLKKSVFEDYHLFNFVKKTKLVKNFRIEFLEPTYFNTLRSDNVIRLPIPELIFSNLVSLWNEFYEGTEKIDEQSFLEWVNKSIYLSSLNIKTKAKEMGEPVPAVGYVGWVNFEINKNKLEYAKYVDLLCQFGELTNLGGNRTAGFGVIKYTPIEYFKTFKTN